MRPPPRRRPGFFIRLIALVLLGGPLAGIGHAQIPLTTARLRELALAAGIGKGLAGVTLNREIGLAFQDLALRAIREVENKEAFDSPRRTQQTALLAKKERSVVPDAVRTALLLGEGRKIIPYPKSIFLEVKATRFPLRLASRNWQILGLVDAVSLSPGGRSPSVGAVLIFFTTADTEIAPDVLITAAQFGVQIWQRKAYVQADGAILFEGQRKLGLPPPGKAPQIAPDIIAGWSRALYLQKRTDPLLPPEPPELDEQ